MRHPLPYADSQMVFDLPYTADIAETPTTNAHQVELIVPPIDLKGKTRAVIVFTDATRHSPDQWLAEKILAALPTEQVTFLCAIGMHRPSTQAEKVAKLGAEIVNRYPVLDHDPQSVLTIGMIDGIPVEVNPLLIQPDSFLIMTGVVEPHQYAGYSGGAKTAVIGCGGATTISLTHGPAMLDRAGVRLGNITNNPFQNFVRQAGEKIGIGLIANVVMPSYDSITHAAVGGIDLHDKLVAEARQLYEVPVPNAPYDIVLAGVSAPKAVNLYQASRAATYIGLSGAPVLRKGGVIIVPAQMPEGAGQGVGEQNFLGALQHWGTGEALIQHFRAQGCRPGEQRAYMIAQLLAHYHCIFVGAAQPDVVIQAGFHHEPDSEAALERAYKLLGQTHPPKVLIVPDALKTIPV